MNLSSSSAIDFLNSEFANLLGARCPKSLLSIKPIWELVPKSESGDGENSVTCRLVNRHEYKYYQKFYPEDKEETLFEAISWVTIGIIDNKFFVWSC